MFSFIKKYGFTGSFYMLVCFIRTKLTFNSARLIRFPIDLRGKKFISVGKGFTAGRGCRLEALPQEQSCSQKLMQIGNNVEINDYVHITATINVSIGDNVLIASKVYISDVVHGCYKDTDEQNSSPETPPGKRPLRSSPVIIEKNVWLGDNVCVLPGVTLGEGCMIGANAVVNKSIPENCMAAGIPAIVIKKFDFDKNKWISVKHTVE